MIINKNKIISIILIFVVTMSMLSSAAEPEPTNTPKTPTITMDIFPVKTPTNITTQLIRGSGMASGCKGGTHDITPLIVTVNGLAASIDPSTNTFSRSISLSEGVNTITVTATIGICSVTKTTSILLDTSAQTVANVTANQPVVIPDGNQPEIVVETINTTTVKPTETVNETSISKPTPKLLSGFDIVNVIFALFGDENAKIRQEANVLNDAYNAAVENEDWDNMIQVGEILKVYITDYDHNSVLNENGWVDKVLGILIENAVVVAKYEPALTPTPTATPMPTPTITETQTPITPSTTSIPQPTSASISSTTMKYKGEYKINSTTAEWFSVGLGGYWKSSVSAVIPFEITLQKQEWGTKFNGETKVRVNWVGEWGEKDTLVKKTSVTGTLAGTGDVKIVGEFNPDYPEMVLIGLDEGDFFTHTYIQYPKPLNKDDLGYNFDMFVKPGGMFYGPLFDEQVAFWNAATSKKVLGKFKTTGSSVTVNASGTKLGLMAGNYLKGGQYTITANLAPTK